MDTYRLLAEREKTLLINEIYKDTVDGLEVVEKTRRLDEINSITKEVDDLEAVTREAVHRLVLAERNVRFAKRRLEVEGARKHIEAIDNERKGRFLNGLPISEALNIERELACKHIDDHLDYNFVFSEMEGNIVDAIKGRHDDFVDMVRKYLLKEREVRQDNYTLCSVSSFSQDREAMFNKLQANRLELDAQREKLCEQVMNE